MEIEKNHQHHNKHDIAIDFNEQETVQQVKKPKKSKFSHDTTEVSDTLTWKDFNLHPYLLNNLQKLKYTVPTEIQRKVLRHNSHKVDLVIQARTGEGKTLCYGLPIADHLLKMYDTYPNLYKNISPVALILVPTRELGIQIKNHLENILLDHEAMYDEKKKLLEAYNKKEAIRVRKEKKKEKALIISNKKTLNSKASQDTTINSEITEVKSEEEVKEKNPKLVFRKKSLKDFSGPNRFIHKIRIANIMGGFAKVKQVKMLKRSPEIIIATPGRLWELLDSDDIFVDFQKLRYLVVDEADRMMEKHHFSELKNIIKMVYKEKESEEKTEADLELNKKLKERIKKINKFSDSKDLKFTNNDKERLGILDTREPKKESDEEDNEDIKEEEECENEEEEENNDIEDLNNSDNADEFDENAFMKSLLKEKGLDAEENDIEDVDMADFFDHLKAPVIDESGFVSSKRKRRRANLKKQTETSNTDLELNEEKEQNDDEEINEDEENEDEEIEEEEDNEDEELEEEGEEDEVAAKEGKSNLKVKEKVKNKSTKFKYQKTEEDVNILPDRYVSLRTILCSATVEIKSKEKNKISKAIQKKNYDTNKRNFKNNKNKKKEQEEIRETELLDNLIKNLKFYNKLIYIKLDARIKFTEENIPDLTTSAYLPSKLDIQAFKCESDKKDYYLYHFLYTNKDKTIIVFTNSISQTKKLYSIFSFFDFKVKCLHSQMQQKQRISKLDSFRNSAKLNKVGEKNEPGNILFCTDVGSRGLDIPEVDIVINYHIPLNSENFVHRSGRTARALKSGQCLNLVCEKELNLYKKILRELKIYELSLKSMPISQLDQYKVMFDHVKKMEKESFLKKKNLRESEWIRKQAEKADLILDDNLDDELNFNDKEAMLIGKVNKSNLKAVIKREEANLDAGISRKMLGKKKNKENLNYLEKKKLHQNILSHDISRSSYLNPHSITTLNKLINSNDKMREINLTQTLRNAYDDINGVKKSKHRKTRHVHRKKGK